MGFIFISFPCRLFWRTWRKTKWAERQAEEGKRRVIRQLNNLGRAFEKSSENRVEASCQVPSSSPCCKHRGGCIWCPVAAVRLDAGGSCTVKCTLKFTEFPLSHIKNKLKSTSYENVKSKGSFGFRGKIEIYLRKTNAYIKFSLYSYGDRTKSPFPFFFILSKVCSFHAITNPGSERIFCNYIWLSERQD